MAGVILMMFFKSTTIALASALCVALVCISLTAYAESLQGITAPNADITLSFVMPGQIDQILVQEGSLVQKDQPLVHLFDKPERIQSEQYKVLSEDNTKIESAEAELAQKRVDLTKLKKAKARGAASDWEVEHLRRNVRIAELALKAAKLEQEQYHYRYDHTMRLLERMRLRAPIAGQVEEIRIAAGESIGPLGPVLRIVQNDPLWIDLPVPMDLARSLKNNQVVEITFPGAESDSKTANGRIVHIGAVADTASETLRMRIEVPNPQNRPAGERVQIALPSPPHGFLGAQLTRH